MDNIEELKKKIEEIISGFSEKDRLNELILATQLLKVAREKADESKNSYVSNKLTTMILNLYELQN